MKSKLERGLQNWCKPNVQMYFEGETLKIHRSSSIGSRPLGDEVQIAERHEKGAILLYQLLKRKLTKFVSMQMFWKQSSVFNGTSVSKKPAKRTAKAAINAQKESWTKEQPTVDDERNVGTKLWKKEGVPFKNTSQEDILSVFTRLLAAW